MLNTLTTIVNSAALAAALWLAIYVVTRSPRSLVAWLTGATLWSISGLFFNTVLALNPPPAPAASPIWNVLLIPFWRPDVFEAGGFAWLLGWQITPAVALWHHATTLMRPGSMTPWRWARVVGAYVVAGAAVLVQVYTPLMFTRAAGDPLYLNSLLPGPLFSLFAAFLVLFTVASIINLQLSARATRVDTARKQLRLLAAATVVAGLAGPVAAAALAFDLPIPRVVLTLLLGTAVVLMGYGVSQHSALMAGRVLRRDFYYNAAAVGLVALLYGGVAVFSVQAYQVPAAAFIFVLMLVVVTHSLVDAARPVLDFVFYRGEEQRLRASLRRLAGTIGEDEPLDNRLAHSLEALCASVRATSGLIVLFEEQGVAVAAACGRPETQLALTRKQLAADDVRRMLPGQLPPPLAETALLMPLYDEQGQMGALLLGQPENGLYYSEGDVELLLHPVDRLADAIRDARREAAHLETLARLAEARPPTAPAAAAPSVVKLVEEALRNLTSFAYLGQHPLAEWQLVRASLSEPAPTVLDRGKAVYNLLAEAVEKLRPADDEPGDPPPREWYAYIIIHSAYLEDVPNRDIMSRLYISEGTFNRTRRAALQALALALEESEQALAV